MKRWLVGALLVALAGVVVVIDSNRDPIAILEGHGGKIERNEQGDVVELKLGGTNITDTGLVYLKGFTKLQTLNLYGTQITDAGLVHLKGLQLTNLAIPKQSRTDLGLKHYLAALKTHTALNLVGWRITDSGLLHLKGLTSLESLRIGGSITDAGIADLKKSLPNCEITK